MKKIRTWNAYFTIINMVFFIRFAWPTPPQNEIDAIIWVIQFILLCLWIWFEVYMSDKEMKEKLTCIRK